MEKHELLSALFRGGPEEDFELFAQKYDSGRGSVQMGRLNYWVCLLFMLLATSPRSGASQKWDGIIVTQADYEALRAIKQSFTDPNGVLRSWNDSGLSACSGGWAGIKCAKGKVIILQLPWRGLGGRISEKIGQLASLRKLNLHDNFIGGLIPTSLGFLPKLRGLILFNNQLVGQIPPELGNCPLLQTIDLSNNTLEGFIPTGLFISTKLYRLNLSHNSLSGPVPVSLTHSISVTFVDLSYNNISGLIPDTWGNQTGKDPYQLKTLFLNHNQLNNQIPESLDRLQNLSKLDFSENDLVGPIPPSLTKLPHLEFLNVSSNNLSGPVPFQLTQKFKTSSFRGNLLLCGYDVSVPCSSPPPSHSAPPLPPPPAKSHSHRLNNKDVILIVAGVLLVVVLVICCILLLCLINRRTTAKKKDTTPRGTAAAQGEKASQPDPVAGGEAGGKLVHFDGPLVFTADDLLCATAEIMGKSTYGTVYKATLEDGSEVAVKRLREKIAKGQKEFETEVNALGQIRHPNLLALRAYYVGPKGEKLLVFDYMPKGSLASFLHARGPDTPINWATRLNIAIGVAQGINYLHIHLNMVHGNLTSANILLDEKNNSKVSDYGISRLMTTGANSNVIATAGALGYSAPELPKVKKASTKTDVYSLGVILLELLTGKSPGEAMNGVDLPQWVASTMKEEWTNEVFDLELMRESAAGDELLDALKLALHCVDPTPSARPEVEQVLQQLMEMKQEVTEGSEQERAAEPSND